MRHRAEGAHELERRHRESLAEGDVGLGERRPALDRHQQPRALAGQVDAGGAAEAERADRRVEVAVGDAQRGLDRADVRRLGDHLAEGERAERLVVRDAHAGERDAAHLAVEPLVGRDQALLERRRGGHHLEGRAGLVGVGDDAVAPGLRVGRAEAVGIEGRPGGHREHGAGRRVEHHQAAALRAQPLHARGELALGDRLQRRVEREVDVAARHRRGRRQVGRHGHARLGVAQHGAPPRLAGDHLLVHRLEPAQAVIVGADVAEHLGCGVAQRVVALRLLEEVDAGELEIAHRARLRRIELAREPDELAVAGELARELRAVAAEDPGERRRGALGVLDLARHREGRLHLDRDRELAPARVVDRAARRVELDHPLLLALGAPGELVVAQHLEVVEPRADRHDPERDDADQHEQAAPHRHSSRKTTCSTPGSARPSSAAARSSSRRGCER